MAAIASAAVTVPGDYPNIQGAINAVITGAVPDGTQINIQTGTYAEVLNISNTAKSLTLKALGTPGSVIVDAAGKGNAALTIVNASGLVVIKGMTFRHGSRIEGGGFVIQQSSPALSNCVFELNTANYGGGGTLVTSNAIFNACTIRYNTATGTAGGVIIKAGSRPVFTGCYIVANVAGTTAPDGVGGGVQSLDSSPTFRGSHINNNSSRFAAGGIYAAGSFTSPYGTSALVLEDSEVSDNVSAPLSAAYGPAEGGGIHIEDNVTATLTRVKILRNKANTGGGLNAYRARYDIVDSVIDSNQAAARSDGGADTGIGGGIDAISTNVTSPARPASIVNLTRSLVRRNTSLVGGGIVVTGDVGIPATLTLTGSVVDSNSTQSQGGGVLVSRTNMTANNSMIIRNTVSGSGTAFGGGIIVQGSSNAAFTGSTVAHNTGNLGGGIFLDGTAALSMSASNVYDNAAVGTNTRGSGIFVGGSGSQTGSIQNSIVADNTDTLFHSQVHEEVCSNSAITYQNNTLTPAPGFSPAPNCSVGGRASGNNSNVPQFAHFLAVPGAGTSSTLVWSVARATSVTIAGLPASNQSTGSVDVTPAASTTYSLTASTPSGSVGPLTASVTVVLPPTGASHAVDGDFDGDGKAEITVFRPSTGTWWVRNVGSSNWGINGDIPVRGDFDGDGKADVAIFRPSAGTWYVVNSSTMTWTSTLWGANGDIPVPGDYDGDGKTDIAVFRPSTATWWVLYSSSSSYASTTFGAAGDVPVPADYDGDGKTDIAVFRPSEGRWYIFQSSTMTVTARNWGAGGDLAVPGDYDGDGRADIAVYRPSTGTWYIIASNSGAGITVTWGAAGDVPVPGDYDGDGKSDVAIYRPTSGAWFIIQSSTGVGTSALWGISTDAALLQRP
jgi:FG-GAP-like repeat